MILSSLTLRSAILSALPLSGCVVGVEQRATPLQAAQAPPAPPPPDGPSAASVLHASTASPGRIPSQPAAQAPRGGRDQVWVAGAYQWDGVRYTWAPGHWEPRADRYRWSASEQRSPGPK